MFRTTTLLFLSCFSLLLMAQDFEADGSLNLNNPDKTILFPLSAAELDGQEHVFTFRLFHQDQELFSEHYIVRSLEKNGGSVPVMNLWMGNAMDAHGMGHLDPIAQAQFRIDIYLDDELLETTNLAQLLEQDRVLRETDSSPVTLVTFANGAKPTEALAEPPSKARFQCPDTFPYCEQEYEYCESRCDYGDPYCLENCSRMEEECYLGRFTSRWSEKVVLSQIFSFQDCHWYPWYNISPKIWNVFEMTFEITDWERRYCPATGQNFNINLGSRVVRERCYQNTGNPCSYDGSSYLGGACKL